MTLAPNIQNALDLLGVNLSATQTSTRFIEAKAAIQDMRKQADRNWRIKAMASHPDQGGTVEEMQALNAAHDIVQRLDVDPLPVSAIEIRARYEVASELSW